MTESRKHDTHPLGILRPESKFQCHELTIILVGNDGQWSSALDLKTGNDAPSQLVIFKIDSPVKKPTGEMKQISNTQSEFVVRLAGPTTMATVLNLSKLPLKDWMPVMFSTFAQCPAAIAVLVVRGRVSVTLHEGD